jgi:hypothetical protein
MSYDPVPIHLNFPILAGIAVLAAVAAAVILWFGFRNRD